MSLIITSKIEEIGRSSKIIVISMNLVCSKYVEDLSIYKIVGLLTVRNSEPSTFASQAMVG
jgi:hypothetical protein